jgi:hypothetical protein
MEDIVNKLFKILLTLNATLLLVIVFLVQKTYTLEHFFKNCDIFVELPDWVSYITYFLIPVILTGISIKLSSFLGKDEFKEGEIICIEHANNSFLPSYLGYFFVALSINNWESLVFVYSVLFIFTYKSQALYFNPLFLLFGFEFYNIKTKKGTTVFLISRKQYRNPDEVIIKTSYRINNYTFIERG